MGPSLYSLKSFYQLTTQIFIYTYSLFLVNNSLLAFTHLLYFYLFFLLLFLALPVESVCLALAQAGHVLIPYPGELRPVQPRPRTCRACIPVLHTQGRVCSEAAHSLGGGLL